MGALITYDVSDKQVEIKSEMKKLGYMDSWQANNQIYNLPNSTLWKNEIEHGQAVSDLTNICARLNVKLVRAIAVPSNPWSGIPGEKHTS